MEDCVGADWFDTASKKLGFEVGLAAPSSFWRFVSDMRALKQTQVDFAGVVAH